MASHMKNVLITGGAGFIGSHTADLLINQGYHVRILDMLDPQIHNTSGSFPQYLSPQIEKIKGDVRSLSDLKVALKDIDYVYHFAALTGVGQSMYDISHYTDINVTGTATLIEAIIRTKTPIKKLVLASSRAVYGEGSHACPEHGITYPKMREAKQLAQGEFGLFCQQCQQAMQSVATAEDRTLNPGSIYALTKLQQEHYCQYATETFDIPTCILRYFNVYGSRQSLHNPYTGVMTVFYNRIKAGNPVSLYENGLPGRDFVHISDVAQANVLALQKPATADTIEHYNVGTGQEVSIKDVALAVGQACGKTPDLLDQGEYRVGDIKSCYANIDRIKNSLGFSPQVNLLDGVSEFVRWADQQSCSDNYEQTVAELKAFGLFGSSREPG